MPLAAPVVSVELSEEEAQVLLTELISTGIVTWRHVVQKVLQSLQPPQTATHVPQLAGIRERYPPRHRWAPARLWMYAQYGPCNCGAGLNMTHDHVLPRDLLLDKADLLENLRFLCYRCNQSRHWMHGGKLELGTAAAAIYLLFRYRPRTLKRLTELGRDLGLTQSDQRFEETWALAVYLHGKGAYELDEIHPTVSKDELSRWRAYFLDANSFFEELSARLRAKFSDRVERWEHVQLLVTTRKTSVEDRRKAAKGLGILARPGVAAAIEAETLDADGRRLLLEAVGGLSAEEASQIATNQKVALYHLLTSSERADVLTEIDVALASLQKKHGVSDDQARPLADSP